MAAPILQFGKGTILIGPTATPTAAVECQVTSCVVTPSSNLGQVPGTYCQGPSSFAQGSNFSLDLAWLSDWGATNSLSQLLWDNDGSTLFIEMTPDDANIPTMEGEFYAIAGTFGGEGDSLWTSSQSMPMTTKPTLTPQEPPI